MIAKSHPFKEVRHIRGAEEVAAQIQQAIVGQDLAVGDKLPSQRELSGVFNVSVSTVVSALRLLEQSGLVYTKRGATGGSFVSEMNTQAFTESLRVLLGRKKVTMEELAEFRILVEGKAAYWAAERRKDEDLKFMLSLLDNMREMLVSNSALESFLRLDMSFHLAIGKASGNSLATALIEIFNQCFLEEAFSFIPAGEQARIHDDLTKICEAIQAGKGQLAEKLVEDHILYFSALILRGVNPIIT